MSKYEYTDGETVFEGYMVSPEGEGKRPGILIAHAWDGPNDYFNRMAIGYARRGFVAFAIDVYGKGKRGKIDGDNGQLMNPLLEDRGLLKRRLLAALNELQKQERVHADKTAVLGYCFGGLCALDLARANPRGLKAAVSIHAPLTPSGLSQNKIGASLLVLHGWEDPVAKPASVLEFANEMTKAGADWQIHAYGHAKHAFTFEGADIPALGIKYDEKANRRSECSTRDFLSEIFE